MKKQINESKYYVGLYNGIDSPSLENMIKDIENNNMWIFECDTLEEAKDCGLALDNEWGDEETEIHIYHNKELIW